MLYSVNCGEEELFYFKMIIKRLHFKVI